MTLKSVLQEDVALEPARPAGSDRAYVTLVTSDGYATGATGLVRSLVLSGTGADIVVLHTDGAPQSSLAPLAAMGARLVRTDLLPTSNAFNRAHARDVLHRVAPFDKGNKPPLHTPLDNFTKLRLWQLTEYAACVFIDADAMVLQNIDELFDYPEFRAAPNVYEGWGDFHRLNSGVFTARPDTATFRRMLEKLDRPGVFWRRTDQTFLEHYFPQWHGLPITYNMLQYVWFNIPELWDWRSVKLLHYQYEKPWQDPHPKAELLAPLIRLWHAYAEGGSIPSYEELGEPAA